MLEGPCRSWLGNMGEYFEIFELQEAQQKFKGQKDRFFAQYLDARFEMRERVLKVLISIAEHINKIQWSQDLHFR